MTAVRRPSGAVKARSGRAGAGSRPAPPSPGGIRVVDRVVQLLDLLAETAGGVGVTEIAGRLGLGKSTTHRLLTSLARVGVARVDPAARLYHLGYRPLRWTSSWLDRLDARTRALPHLRHLREKCQETVSLNLKEGLTRVAVERLEASQEVRFVADVGKPLALHTGAGGKAILAFLSPPEIDRVLETAGLPAGDERALRRGLAGIRRTGVAVSFGERVPGSGAVSAPVFDHAGQAIGSVSILSVAVRLSPDTVRSHTELVRQAAGAISLDLGWPGPEAAPPSRSYGRERR